MCVIKAKRGPADTYSTTEAVLSTLSRLYVRLKSLDQFYHHDCVTTLQETVMKLNKCVVEI